VQKIQAAYKAEFGDKVSTEVNIVSPDIAKELAIKAIYGILIASVAISIYVCIRFEWRYAVAAIIAILHDAFIVISLFAIFRLEVDLPFIAAVLTTIGYSINDKIVIFDRIRENLRFAKLKTDEDLTSMINDSIWQTMSRNINTVLVVLVAAGCLYIFGSESIKLFALAKLVGLASGAYSSIFIACSLWFLLKRKSLGGKKKIAANNS
jgi:preprotein translocase subunit SecF